MARLEFGNLKRDTITKESSGYGEESIRVERQGEKTKETFKKNYGYNKNKS
jgi:hypothetical protein